jgi:hypothetical protein
LLFTLQKECDMGTNCEVRENQLQGAVGYLM